MANKDLKNQPVDYEQSSKDKLRAQGQELKDKTYLSLRSYLLIVVLPLLVLVCISVSLLWSDIQSIKQRSQYFHDNMSSKIVTIKDTINFMNGVNHKIYLTGFASLQVAHETYEDLALLLHKDNLKNFKDPLKSSLTTIKIELDKFIEQRDSISKLFSEVSDNWLLMLDDLIDIYRLENIKFKGNRAEVVSITTLHGLSFSGKETRLLLQSLTEPIDLICKKELKNNNKTHLFERCASLDKKIIELQHDLKILEAAFNFFDNRYQRLVSMVDKASKNYYDTQERVVGGKISSLHDDITTTSRALSIVIFIFIGLLIVEHLIVYFICLKPLSAISEVLSYFNRHLKPPKILPKVPLKEAQSIFRLLYPIFNNYTHVSQQNLVLSERFDKLKVLTYIDDLTKIRNRRAFNEFLDETCNVILRNVAVLMIDIDFFKKVNDSAGHMHGDRVLYLIAKCLRENVWKEDFVYRYGGEEFCIILPDITQDNAYHVAKRLCYEVEKMNIPHPAFVDTPITVSIGVSSVLEEKDNRIFNCNDLIAQADSALYEAKLAGRNRAMLFSDRCHINKS